MLVTYREETKQPLCPNAGPPAPWFLSSAGKLIRYLHGSYFLPYRNTVSTLDASSAARHDNCRVWCRQCLAKVFIPLHFISIFWCIDLFFYSDVSLSPCRWKTAPEHEAATSTLYFWDGTLHVMSHAWFPSNRMLGIERILFLTVWGSFRCFFANSKCVFMCLHWREDWVLPHCHKAQLDGVLLWCLSFCRFLIWSWSSTRVTIRLLVTTLTKALLHQLLSLARRPALGRVLVVSNVFH